MNRLYFFLVAGCVFVLSTLTAATSPFSEGVISINQSVEINTSANDIVAQANEIVSLDDISKAVGSLNEASEKYSQLLRKFADDPSKFADENGDYREFVQKLISLAQRLGEVSKELDEIAKSKQGSQNPPTDEAAAAGESSVTRTGTVRVNTSLNIRTSPWGTIIGSLRNDDRVEIIGQNGDWYQIRHNGQTAYVHANYVDTSERRAGNTPVNQPSQPSSAPPASNLTPNPDPSARGGGLTAAPCQPMPSRVSSEYGWRIHPTLRTRRFHSGIDLPVPNGTRLNALGNGTVVAVGYESGGGKFIKVRYDNGYESFYCHLQNYSVRQGARVAAGQEIARSDNTGQWTTGAHLHFGLKRNGQSVNPRSAGIPLP